MDTNAQALVVAAQNGDELAAVRLIELFYAKIYAFLRRLTASDADAADLTQKTFNQVWRMLPRVTSPTSVASWIHRIAYHSFIDWRRAAPAHEARSDEWWARLAAESERPDDHAARTDLAATVFAVVDRLEPELRHTVHLHYYQGLTLQETADAMGVAASTIKYRLRQAVRELQNKMSETPPAQLRIA
jgi:RNA polymerase sigma-70 factor (ECF subfamily)